MDIGFFFRTSSGTYQLPLNPEEIEISHGTNNQVHEIVQYGEINKIRGRKLSTISFDFLLPGEDWFPGMNTRGSFRKPITYINAINDVLDDMEAIRFIVTGMNINQRMSIESFDYSYEAGAHEDAHCSIELKQYRDYGIIEIEIEKPKQKGKGTAPKGNEKQAPAEITIGSSVIVNGRVHYDSYGSKPGISLTNYQGKISNINKKGSHPYHVTNPSGGWLGWVTSGGVRLA